MVWHAQVHMCDSEHQSERVLLHIFMHMFMYKIVHHLSTLLLSQSICVCYCHAHACDSVQPQAHVQPMGSHAACLSHQHTHAFYLHVCTTNILESVHIVTCSLPLCHVHALGICGSRMLAAWCGMHRCTCAILNTKVHEHCCIYSCTCLCIKLCIICAWPRSNHSVNGVYSAIMAMCTGEHLRR